MTNPADQLIFAGDSLHSIDSYELYRDLRNLAGISFFKFRMTALFDPDFPTLREFLISTNARIMYDLKVYDTRDSVAQTIEVAEKYDATFITVHADCVEWAVRAAEKAAILSVGVLTDQFPGIMKTYPGMDGGSHGLVCPPTSASYWKRKHPGKIVVCPGIRMESFAADNHRTPVEPSYAIANGADFLVVGRPIYNSYDPVECAKRYIGEIEKGMAKSGK